MAAMVGNAMLPGATRETREAYVHPRAVSASETEFFEPSEEFGGRSGSQKKLRAGHGKHAEAAQPGRPPLSPSLSPPSP